MTLADSFSYRDTDGERTIFTIKLEKNRFVDVMYIHASNLLYLMQLANGAFVHNEEGTSINIPVEEPAILSFVREKVLTY